VIMLNTDLHNPNIKPERRMTLESFIRNNRGISENGSDLPTEFLEGIFDRIKKNPFSLKEDDAARERVATTQTNQYFDTSLFFEAPAFFGTGAEERKRERFKKEREEMMAATTQLIRRRQPGKAARAMTEESSRLTESVSPSDVVKPMFDVTWGPVIGILSQVLECSEDERSISVCLNGFVYAIRLASHSHMSIARDTFVTSLAKFTFLGSIKEMKRKNIESIRTLLSIAVIDGEYLGESWGPVLQCTSQLARLRLSASGLDSDESFLSENETPSKSSRAALRIGETPADGRKTEESNGKAVLEAVNEVLIDKVFSNTVNLSAQSLAHFIEQLIEVSTAEVNGSSKSGITGAAGRPPKANGGSTHGEDGPSIFLLQKLVEVADFNMDVRPRLVWAQMWERMAEFFAAISSNENNNVSVFAIDSLKQLSFKFLDKPELTEFNFQRIYLRPFLHVMQQDGTRENIRELVLRCLDNIVRTKSHNLRSGWKIIFSILARSAEDSSEKINFLGLAILQCLLDDHLDELCRQEENENLEEAHVKKEEHHMLPSVATSHRSADVEDFVGLCRASSAFIQKKESESPRPMGLSMRALCHTALYADVLADNRIHPPLSGAQVSQSLRCATMPMCCAH
jgi:brefeldin A-inhibited guanine nucleotide-exchange protein